MAYFVIPSLRGIFGGRRFCLLLAKIPRRLGMTKDRFDTNSEILNNL